MEESSEEDLTQQDFNQRSKLFTKVYDLLSKLGLNELILNLSSIKIILSSHVLQELEEFDGKIIALEQGQIKAISKMDDLRKSYGINFLEKFYFSISNKSVAIKE